MSKDLSRQLCELCGIEAKFFALMQSEENWEEIHESVYYKIKDCSTTKIIYPDFTKPENFVKLLKIWLAIFGEFRLERHSMSMEPEEKLITDCLIRTSDDFYPVNKLKQSIREAEWVYG